MMARKGLKFDVPLCMGVLALVGIGMVLIYSSSAPYAELRGRPESFYLAAHVKRVLIGLIAFLVAMAVPYKLWERFAAPLVLFAIAMLGFIFVSGADSINGARRWITVASFGLQPSELAKLAVVFYLARRLAEKARSGEITRLGRGLVASLAIPLLTFGLILLQPNFSTAATVLGITVALVFAAGARPAHLVLLGGLALPAMLAMMLSSPYRLRRVMAFLDPSSNPASSHQSEQALISLGNGGLIGTGLGEGTQKLGYLPMPFTDTVFAILGEELGFMGTMAILLLFGLVVWRGLRIARACPDRFGSLMAAGLTVSIALNVVMHVGVCVSLFPTTGQPLPFVSYGGTSLIANLVAMGILLNVSSAATVPAEPAPPLVWRSARRTSPLRPFTHGGRA
jgi:cell division protein FtsW